MLYLLYIIDGNIKKLPFFGKKEIVLGRSSKCDFILNSEYLSREHLRVLVNQDSIQIFDLHSTNGVFIGGKKVKSGTIKLHDSFFIQDIEFILKEGEIEDFKISNELSKIINIKNRKEKSNNIKDDTKYFEGNIFKIAIRRIIDIGLKSKSLGLFFLEANSFISTIINEGILVLLEEKNSTPKVLYQHNFSNKTYNIEFELFQESKFLFSKEFRAFQYNKSFLLYSSFICSKEKFAFVYITPQKISAQYFEFFKRYLETVSIISGVIPKHKNKDPIINKDVEENFIITVNKDIRNLIKKAKKLSNSDIFILIEGESGVGKELFAQLIHKNSIRKKNKFIAINCAALPDNLLEAELFGYEKGSFTGAYTQKEGKLELSSGGTLLLDEIAEMQLALQAKLLRAIQEGTFYRIGGTKLIKVDLKIISSTNKNLELLVKQGKFREDLYYRLVHVNLKIPPLRERRNDINSLISFFTQKFLKKLNKEIAGYSTKVIDTLNEYNWPGNIRELENEIHKLINLVDDGGVIDFDLLSPRIQAYNQEMIGTTKFNGIKDKLANFEKENIINLLIKNKGNKSKTSKDLCMSYNTLFRKIKKYSIKI
jgi:transcriptional regulator with PAS, ATPase and Fis domain